MRYRVNRSRYNMEELVEDVKKWKKANKLTDKDIAEMSGLSVQTVKNFFSGAEFLSVQSAERIAYAADLHMERYRKSENEELEVLIRETIRDCIKEIDFERMFFNFLEKHTGEYKRRKRWI